ncbi:hypothetical protein [Aureliella helgolandensis]|uniref:PEP-CTERM protein-sorting domain-containing protein n=1 Tax=Aureliella helgolandensis TaxID=2527968 RepID=A0A518GE10_9BACT|nr:hypothetical protein [Aureliella helgolandensis]QDV26835.1 hypothetical protein Q31a_52140 [Aureliella helgolandensis]
MFKKIICAAILAALSVVPVSNANATILVNNWTVDLDGAFGTVDTFGTISGIDQIGFTGLFHQHLDGAPVAGSRIAVDGLIQVNGLVGGQPAANISSKGAILSSSVIPLTKTFEMTASFSVTNQITDVTGDVVTFVHEAFGAAAIDGAIYDGYLDIYLDDLGGFSGNPLNTGAVSDVNPTTGGAGFEDGVHIARFGVMGGNEGTVNLSELDGNDSVTFQLVWGKSGVLFDEFGGDLSLLTGAPEELLIADASSTLDSDGGLGVSAPKPSNWPGADAGGFAFDEAGSFGDAYGQEDGSLNFQSVPEPASATLWLGLVGATSLVRKRRKNRA